MSGATTDEHSTCLSENILKQSPCDADLSDSSLNSRNKPLFRRNGTPQHLAEVFDSLKAATPTQAYRIATASLFASVMSYLVVLSIVMLAISTAYDRKSQDIFIIFFVLHSVFTSCFAFETIFYIIVAKHSFYKSLCWWADLIFVLCGIANFALGLSIISISDPPPSYWNANLALNVTQLLRIYRFVFLLPELRILAKGILHSCKSLRWTGVFVITVIFGCSIFTTWTFGINIEGDEEGTEQMYEMWGNIGNSMFTLFTVLTLEGWNDICYDTYKHYPSCKFFFVLYISFVTITLMNVVTGVVLDAYVDMSQRITASTAYEKFLATNKLMESLLVEAFETHPPGSVPPKKKPAFHHKRAYDLRGAILNSLFYSRSDKHGSGNARSLLPLNKHRTEERRKGSDGSNHLTPEFKSGQSPHMDISINTNDNTPKTMSRRRPRCFSDGDSVIGISDKPNHDDILLPTNSPAEILLRPDVAEALQDAEVPLYLAFDVLHIFHIHGIERVTVTEFCDGCSRILGPASGRQLMHLELSLNLKLRKLQKQLSRISGLMNRFVRGGRPPAPPRGYLQSFSHDNL